MSVYILGNPKTKSKLKQMLADQNAGGSRIMFYQPGYLSDAIGSNYTGTKVAEGPHYPEAHKWWAELTVKDGLVVKVK
jgi:hypothetical protein